LKKTVDIESYLPPLLKREHIARIEDNLLLVGDRRKYPWELTHVACRTVDDIAKAIRDMVTQGGGPLQVAMTTLRFVARQIQHGELPDKPNVFIEVANTLKATRPTNTTMARTLQELVAEIGQWYVCDGMRDVHSDDLVGYVDQIIDRKEASFDADYDMMSDIGSHLIPDGTGILTTCFAEHTFLLSLAKATQEGKRFTVYVPETRPYLQGARLTAPSLQAMGLEVFVITDGMGAHFMETSEIGIYMSAADLVTMDGTVVNKVGTLANAICARHYHIPYHVFAMSPDPTKATRDDIVMEERDGNEVLRCGSAPTTLATLKGRYPAFDIIRNEFVEGIITPKGWYKPSEIGKAYRT